MIPVDSRANKEEIQTNTVKNSLPYVSTSEDIESLDTQFGVLTDSQQSSLGHREAVTKNFFDTSENIYKHDLNEVERYEKDINQSLKGYYFEKLSYLWHKKEITENDKDLIKEGLKKYLKINERKYAHYWIPDKEKTVGVRIHVRGDPVYTERKVKKFYWLKDMEVDRICFLTLTVDPKRYPNPLWLARQIDIGNGKKAKFVNHKYKLFMDWLRQIVKRREKLILKIFQKNSKMGFTVREINNILKFEKYIVLPKGLKNTEKRDKRAKRDGKRVVKSYLEILTNTGTLTKQKYKNCIYYFAGDLKENSFRIEYLKSLELQKNNYPHFHVLLFNLPYIEQPLLSEKWDSLKMGTNVHIERVEGKTSLKYVNYLFKITGYMRKAEKADLWYFWFTGMQNYNCSKGVRDYIASKRKEKNVEIAEDLIDDKDIWEFRGILLYPFSIRDRDGNIISQFQTDMKFDIIEYYIENGFFKQLRKKIVNSISKQKSILDDSIKKKIELIHESYEFSDDNLDNVYKYQDILAELMKIFDDNRADSNNGKVEFEIDSIIDLMEMKGYSRESVEHTFIKLTGNENIIKSNNFVYGAA